MRRSVFQKTRFIRRQDTILNGLAEARHARGKVTAQQAIKVVFHITGIVHPAEHLKVHLAFQRSRPLADEVLYEMQVLLLGVAERAVREVLKEDRRHLVGSRDADSMFTISSTGFTFGIAT